MTLSPQGPDPAQDTRQRDICPLPPPQPRAPLHPGLSQPAARRARRARCMDRVLNDAIGAANSLFTGSRICSDAPPTLAQRSALHHMEVCVTSSGPPPQPQDPGAPRRMLSEVRAASPTYGVGNHVQPYQKDRVSWAPAGLVPVPIGLALCEPDREWFGTWATHCLFLRRRLRPRPRCLDWSGRTWTPSSRTTRTPTPTSCVARTRLAC